MKILLEIHVPSIAESFDVLLPDFLTMRELVPLIAQAVEDLSNRRYVSSGCEIICCAEDQRILDSNRTLREYSIRNGDHLMFF
jgi:uncharacterized ubiquitin-like protein YukD